MKLTVKFTIEGHDIAVGEEARMWIDVNRNGVLSDNEEVDLMKDDLTWTGSIDSDEATSEGLLFTLKFIASPGTAKWSLEVHSDQGGDHLVCKRQGDVKFLKSIVVGALNL
jgi:hypothetical protein